MLERCRRGCERRRAGARPRGRSDSLRERIVNTAPSGLIKRTVFSWQYATSVTPASGSILKVMNLYARFSLSLANSSLHLSVGNTPDMVAVA